MMSIFDPEENPTWSELYLSTNILFEAGMFFSRPSLVSTNPAVSGFTPVAHNPINLWVITADNPESIESSNERNAQFRAELEAELIVDGFSIEPVTCTAADSNWVEHSFAIAPRELTSLDESRSALQKLAVKYWQNSIFEITGGKLKLVAGLRSDIQGEKEYNVFVQEQGENR